MGLFSLNALQKNQNAPYWRGILILKNGGLKVFDFDL
jgi:hypothetical protein